jgi:hypothetical protein
LEVPLSRVSFLADTANMAAGSRKKFALDLNDIIAFPDAAHMPVFPPTEKESWILLMEVRNPTFIPEPRRGAHH